ncbi:MAG: 6-pyruvoyl-tetrahydropterin synthase-related protein [Sphingomicrobium sp.]
MLIVAVVAILAAAASRLWLLPVQFSADPNEGWNGFQAWHAMGAGPLYPPPGALTGNNYPPLSFYVVGALGRIVGDAILAGRMVALLSVVGIAATIFALLRRFGRSGFEGSVGVLLFLLLNATVLRDYLALNDPQWLGHLLIMVGVVLIVPQTPDDRPTAKRLVIASLFMLQGGLIKINLIAWPLAATAWLGWYHRRSLLLWLAVGLCGAAVAVFICWVAFGPDFFTAMLTPRGYTISRIVHRGGGALLVTGPLLWWSWPFLAHPPEDRRLNLIRLAVLFSVVFGFLQRGGAGIHFNAHFESAIALSISSALAAGSRQNRAGRTAAVLGIAALLAVGFGQEVRELRRFSARQPAWLSMEQRIAAVPGEVACETQALCFWAGKRFAIDFFLYSQRAFQTGDSSALDRALAQRRFAAVEIDADSPLGDRGPNADPILLRLSQTMLPVFVDATGRQMLMPKR